MLASEVDNGDIAIVGSRVTHDTNSGHRSSSLPCNPRQPMYDTVVVKLVTRIHALNLTCHSTDPSQLAKGHEACVQPGDEVLVLAREGMELLVRLL